MTYRVVITDSKKRFPSKFGLNELLSAERETNNYNYRSRKMVYSPNKVKKEGEVICQRCIKKYLKGVRITKPILCTYFIYSPNKEHDRGNVYAGVEKIFLDSLQKENVISSDGHNFVLDSIFHTLVDKHNPRVEVEIEVIE